MSDARNLPAALDAMRAVLRSIGDAPAVTLREVIARARLAGLRDGYIDSELRELLELALLPGATIPAGTVGEAALAYLLADRRGTEPVPAAIARLEALGGIDSVPALAAWVRDLAARTGAQAAALERRARHV